MRACGVVLACCLAVAAAAAGAEPTPLDDAAAAEECGHPQDPLCIRSCTFKQLNHWSGGFSGDLHLYFANTVDSWTADVGFDHPLTSFTTWSCQYNTTDLRTVRLYNQPWDGHHNRNTSITISFDAHYGTPQEPIMNTVKLNGVELCTAP